MDEELDESMDPTAASQVLSKLSAQYTTLGQQQAQARQAAEQSRAERMRRAEEAIRASRFGMPRQSEQLFALSAAMLAPRRMRGLAGTLNNIMPVLGQMSTAKREAEEARADALLKLQLGYAEQGEAAKLAALEQERKGLADLMKVYGPLAKPKSRRTAIDPSSGRVLDLDTGEEVVAASSVPPAAVEQLRTYLGNPAVTEANRQIAIQNFQRQFRVPAAQFLTGGR